ncbi:MAG: dihydrolipoyl dehydrogenase [Clostridiales bacterium]|nr:dihydrolipoyl dehydrogenase [Clostridiales bacterium]
MNEHFDLAVIGAGPGGYEAALEAARLGLHTALIEKDAIGGTCLNRGCIPTKTLLHSADLYDEIRHAARFGICAGEPTVDMKTVQQHKADTVANLQKGIATQIKAAKVAFFQGNGCVLSADSGHLVRVTAPDGSSLDLSAERILLASGSVPSVPPIPGHDLPGVMTSDGLLSYDGKPLDSLLIIGGGVIGVEFAGIWLSLGAKVTILEALPSLIANLDRELGQSLKLSLKKKGADIHTGAMVQSLAASEHGICCTYLEKDQEQTCAAQAVLIATGRRPYTEGLFAENCAPALERGRILVNDHYETTIPGVFAIGDVIGQIQLAHAATAQGRAAVRYMAESKTNSAPALIPSCIYTSPEIASVGLSLDEAKARGIAAKSHKTLSSANGKSVLTLQERGFIKVVYEEETHVILGAQLLCARATDMISEFAVAIQKGLTMEEMARIVRPHPSFSEMITDAVRL